MPMSKSEYHVSGIFFMGISASLWAVMDRTWFMPLLWLGVLCLFVGIHSPKEYRNFLHRLAKIGMTLVGISLLQILFRRGGSPVLTIQNTVIVTSEGFLESALLWIRFMILFALAHIMARVSLFHVMLFLNRCRVPLRLGLLILMTMRLIPYIFQEGKRVLWFFRFKGLQWRSLPLKEKAIALKQLTFSLLMRNMNYVFYLALALELRGYGSTAMGRIPGAYPVVKRDWILIVLTLVINGLGIMIHSNGGL